LKQKGLQFGALIIIKEETIIHSFLFPFQYFVFRQS
jgi:hypothetical protein